MQIIHLASQRLHRLRDVESLVRDVIGLLQDIVVHDFGAVYLIDGDSLSTFAVSDRGLGEAVLSTDKEYLNSLDLRVGQHVTGWVALHNESVVIADASRDPRYLASRPGIRSEICVPMRSRERAIGVINLESTLPAAYTDSDRRILEIVASQIAIAIENAQLHAQTEGFKRLRLMQKVTASVVHDLGNLLMVASAALDALALGPPRDRDKPAVQQAGIAIDKCFELTRHLLRIDKPAAGDARVADLNKLIDATLPLLDVMAGAGTTVTVQHAPQPCPVKATGPAIEQVLMNLLANAREAGASRFEVAVRVLPSTNDTDGSDATVSVSDNGDGMDEETLAHALEPYFSTRGDGRGIGLSTVARLVEEIDGTLNVVSSRGQGATFEIRLPIAR